MCRGYFEMRERARKIDEPLYTRRDTRDSALQTRLRVFVHRPSDAICADP